MSEGVLKEEPPEWPADAMLKKEELPPDMPAGAQWSNTEQAAFGLFSSYVALFRWYTRTGMIYYLPTRAATRAEAQKATYLPRKGG